MNDLLKRIDSLKEQADAYANQVADAKAAKAKLEAKLDSLTERLSELTGTSDWSELDTLIATAATEAQEAAEGLQAAMTQAGIQ